MKLGGIDVVELGESGEWRMASSMSSVESSSGVVLCALYTV